MRKVFLTHYPFWTILLVAFLLRAALPIGSYLLYHDPSLFLDPDTESYVCPAESLITNWTFSCNGIPEIFRTPGYSLLLIPGLLLGRWEALTIALQILFSVATVFLVYKTSLVVFDDHKAALFAAALYAIEPLSITYCSYLLTETLFTFFLMLFVWTLAKYLKTDSWMALFLAAMSLVASVYVRPVSYFLPILVTAVLVIIGLNSASRQRRQRLIKGSIIFLLTSIVLIGLWNLRNFSLTGYSGFSSAKEAVLYGHLGANIIAKRDKISYQRGLQELHRIEAAKIQVEPGERELALSERQEWERDYTMRLIIENPFLYLQEATKNLMLTLFGPGFNPLLSFFDKSLDKVHQIQQNDSVPRQSSIFKEMSQLIGMRSHTFRRVGNIVWGFILVALYVLAILSYRYPIDRENLPSVLCLITVIFYFLMTSAMSLNGYSRFRIPIMPLICVFAGLGLTWLNAKLGHKTKTPANI